MAPGGMSLFTVPSGAGGASLGWRGGALGGPGEEGWEERAPLPGSCTHTQLTRVLMNTHIHSQHRLTHIDAHMSHIRL